MQNQSEFVKRYDEVIFQDTTQLHIAECVNNIIWKTLNETFYPIRYIHRTWLL